MNRKIQCLSVVEKLLPWLRVLRDLRVKIPNQGRLNREGTRIDAKKEDQIFRGWRGWWKIRIASVTIRAIRGKKDRKVYHQTPEQPSAAPPQPKERGN